MFSLRAGWLFCILFVWLCSSLLTGKQRARTSSDVTHSLDDWLGMSVEALKLKCNSLNLSSRGSLAVLAHCLYLHHHPPASLTLQQEQVVLPGASLPSPERPAVPASSTVGTTSQLSSPAPVTIDVVRDEFQAMIPELVAAIHHQQQDHDAVDTSNNRTNISLNQPDFVVNPTNFTQPILSTNLRTND